MQNRLLSFTFVTFEFV